jgi:hypothetical protein
MFASLAGIHMMQFTCDWFQLIIGICTDLLLWFSYHCIAQFICQGSSNSDRRNQHYYWVAPSKSFKAASSSKASLGTWPCICVRAPLRIYKNGPDLIGGGVDWYPTSKLQRGHENLYWRSCPPDLPGCTAISTACQCKCDSTNSYLSTRTGSDVLAFNLKTMAWWLPLSWVRMMVAPSVSRLGRAVRLFSITSCQGYCVSVWQGC